MKPALVVLAAGASTRLSQCKALVDLGGRTPLERLLAAGAACDAIAPLVVAGADALAISTRAPLFAQVAVNASWAAGRTGGVQLAHRLRPGRDLLVAPVDVPLVPAEVFAALLAAWDAAGSPARGFLAPQTSLPGNGPRAGHPVLIGRVLASELETLSAGAPLRALRERAAPGWRVDVSDPAILDDLDTPTDLERLRARLAKN